jgi:hypothetical protein
MNEQEFWAILNNIPEPLPVFYRLYYDDQGHPVCYTMEDLPGKYIDVDQETYILASHNVRVVDNQLVKIKPKTFVHKLRPSDHGTCCDSRDVCVVVDENKTHIKWSKHTNETD